MPSSASTADVVLASVWHDDNKGDSAIAEGVLTLLAEARPDARLTIASMLDERHPGFASAYRHLLRTFPQAHVIPSPVPKPERGTSAAALVAAALRGAAAIAALAGSRRTPLAKAIERSALVVANGGHTLYAQRGPASWIRLVRILYPYWLAQRLRRPYVVFGQSLGPFDDALGRRMVSGVLRGAERVFVRERLSLGVARALGVALDRLETVPDPAFVLTPLATERVRGVQARAGLVRGAYWVVTVRQAYAREGRETETRTYLEEMARFVAAALAAGRTQRVAIVAHTIGPVASEDDRLPARELHQLIASDRVVLIDDDLGPRELAALYGDAEWMVGTRFHSVILALVAGTPTLAVSYFGPKTRGIMSMLGMDDLCVDLATFDARAALERIERADVGAVTAGAAVAIDGFRTDLRAAIAKLPRTERDA